MLGDRDAPVAETGPEACVSQSAFHGTPCLVPVQIRADAQDERRGFITRLSGLAAAVSSDPALVLGQTVRLDFKRPSDAEPITVTGTVGSLLPEGGLWRGRPAALVEFEGPIELEEGGPQLERFERTAGRGPIRLENPGASGISETLAPRGLGRRKRTGRLRRPAPTGPYTPAPAAHPDVDEAVSGTPPAVASGRDIEASFFNDEATAPPAHSLPDDDTTSPSGQRDPWAPPSVGFSDLFSSDDATVPPTMATDPELPTGAASPLDTGNIDAAFLDAFGGGDLPAHSLPPSAYDPVSQAFPGDGFLAESLPGELPDEAIARVSSGNVPVTRPFRSGHEDTRPAPDRPWAADSQGMPPIQDSGAIPTGSVRTGTRPPWEADDDVGTESFLPRNARIASTISVHFWARGRRNDAVADNFSREGLFLTYAHPPPVRGAIVRVEFPLEGEDESLPVRFNAEVRWHRADRPGAGLPDGFGVQILTFETPKDRARYEELLDAILALGPASEPAEKGFSWGTGGGFSP